MPYTAASLPFSGVTDPSRHASYTAATAAEGFALSQRDRVLAYLCASGPASDETIAAALGISRQSLCARRRELMEAGQVRAMGLKQPNPRGVRVTLWEAIARVR